MIFASPGRNRVRRKNRYLPPALALVASVAFATTAAAQTPLISFRPFLLVSGESFTAKKTFNGVFGPKSLRPFWGGGLNVAFKNGVFVELDASRWEQTGQRAFVVNDVVIPVGIAVTATVTPFDVVGGYRVRLNRWLHPYGAAGITRYAYKEVSDAIAVDADGNLDTSRTGLIVLGGAEIRLHKWVGVAADVAYTSVTGILGTGGISEQFREDNLGGTAIRVKVLVGR